MDCNIVEYERVILRRKSRRADSNQLLPSTLKLVVVSDTHGAHSVLGTLPPCDILVHSGDILLCSNRYDDSKALQKYRSFIKWFSEQPAKYRLMVAGNHDIRLQELNDIYDLSPLFGSEVIFMDNKCVEIDEFGLTIFGSCLSHGVSSNDAFQSKEYEQKCYREVASFINSTRKRIDILITHGPCQQLRAFARPAIAHFSGHVHEVHGVYEYQLPPPRFRYPRRRHVPNDIGNVDNVDSIYNIAGPLMNFPHYQPVQPAVSVIFNFIDEGPANDQSDA